MDQKPDQRDQPLHSLVRALVSPSVREGLRPISPVPRLMSLARKGWIKNPTHHCIHSFGLVCPPRAGVAARLAWPGVDGYEPST